MPVNFRKARETNHRCSSCGNTYNESIEIVEFKIGKHRGFLCDICLGELRSKALKMEVLIDKEVKDSRQMQIKNLRNQKKHPSNPNLKINEALKGIDEEEDE